MDTKLVLSNKTIHIYKGVILKSRQRSFQKIRVWDQNGTEPQLGETAKWEMAKINCDDCIA
jgi:hypothetical protein